MTSRVPYYRYYPFLYRRYRRYYAYSFYRRIALGSRLSTTIYSTRLRRIYARTLTLVLLFSLLFSLYRLLIIFEVLSISLNKSNNSVNIYITNINSKSKDLLKIEIKFDN